MRRFVLARTLCWALLLNVMAISCASAAVPLTVGSGTNCDFDDLQTAIDHPNATTTVIRVMYSYAGKPIHFDDGYFVIAGGYPDCNSDSTPIPFDGILENLSILDGSLDKDSHGNPVQQPVISVSGSSALSLSNFQVRNGNNSGRDGGGIRYETFPGDSLGHLELQTVDVHHNVADRGGGIFFRGHGATNEVILSNDSYIEFNTANNAGGGIRLEGDTILTASSPQTTISNNTANPNNADDGLGGGLQVLDRSRARIGSPGFNGRAVIEGNHARFGGGISMHDDATVRLYMQQPGGRARIEGNDALVDGGGIYLKPSGDDNPIHVPELCGFNFGINHNTAQNGAAIYGVDVNTSPLPGFVDHTGPLIDLLSNSCNGYPAGAAVCTPGTSCSTMDDNIAKASDGAVVSVNGDTQVTFSTELLELRRNTAAHLIAIAREAENTISLSSCLIAENNLLIDVIDANSTTTVDGCTITNNALGQGSPVITSTSRMTLSNSIIWQPGHSTISSSNPQNDVDFFDLIISDLTFDHAAIHMANNVQFNVDPQFVHPAGGNYQLKNLSPAIDYSNTCPVVDLVDNFRKVLRNGNTPCDIGAYERQSFPKPTFPADETFETTIDKYALDLPTGWTGNHAGAGDGWFVTNVTPGNTSFAAHAIDPGTDDAPPGGTAQSDSTLATPAFMVVYAGRLSFDHRFNMEGGYDGAILEIKIGSDLFFKEIVAAGGSFVAGGYNGELLPGATPNPIQSDCAADSVTPCLAWTGASNPINGSPQYEHVIVNLPRAADGKMVQVRWRVGSDGNGPQGYEGYYLDNIHVDSNTDIIFKNGFGPLSTDP